MHMTMTDLHEFFYYRLFPRHRYHIVKTGLKPGWHDTDERILHANFQLLVDYIESELAWLEYSMNYEKYGNIGWFRRWRFKRNKEMGLTHLNWEINLPDDFDGRQAASAKEKLALYKWWTEERPKDWENQGSLIDIPNGIYATENYFEKEKSLYQKDEDMLIRLMKIRTSLWT